MKGGIVVKNIKHYFRKVDYILKGGCPVYIKSPKDIHMLVCINLKRRYSGLEPI